jgi:GxxExxY protein
MPHLQEHTIEVDYEGVNIGTLRIDVLVDDILVLELKAVEAVHDLHLAQLVSYLRAGRFALGLLINFNVLRLKDGIYRRLNSDALPP